MTSSLEFEGKNVEDAVKNACSKLKIEEEKLKYDVISYGSTGIFGLVGVKKAKIRVISPRQKREKNKLDNRKKDKTEKYSILREEDRAEIKSIVKESFGELESEIKKEKVVQEKLEGEDDSETKKEVLQEELEGEGESETKKEVLQEELEGEGESETKKEVLQEELEGEGESETKKEVVQEEIEGENESELIAREVLSKIVDLITSGTDIKIEKSESRLNMNVTGGNPAVLIGKKGQTLEAIQYIVEKVVNKKCDERVRIQVDVEGYLENRKQSLERLSSRLADKAKRIGKPVTIGHMNSHDRRIVHLFLKDDREIRTQSIGDGFYRKLVIFPKKGKKYRRKKKK